MAGDAAHEEIPPWSSQVEDSGTVGVCHGASTIALVVLLLVYSHHIMRLRIVHELCNTQNITQIHTHKLLISPPTITQAIYT